MDAGPVAHTEIEIWANDLFAYKLYFTAASGLCMYDYLLTFQDEVDYMWSEKKGIVFYLFIVNRYFALAFCIVTLVAYFLPSWTYEVCNRFAIVEWLQALVIAITAEAVLLIRIYALTSHRPLVLVLSFFIMGQIAVVFVAMLEPGQNGGELNAPGVNNRMKVYVKTLAALRLPDIPIEPFHICILYSDITMDIIYLSLSIAFDVIVFVLTYYLTINGTGRLFPETILLHTLQRDSLLYFCAILSGNLVWLLMVLFARPGIKFINAQPSLLFTSVMINRLTLSLRKANHKKSGRIADIPLLSPSDWENFNLTDGMLSR
ncbi:hypothetical protein L218DRAFT_1082020 [Marasmius fiardii PR-910]|nr:hypothetical protein L218DRAFT_1082020 [Marasmius fiardii PR-910]